ncbi:MAG: tRNA uridine-5-carboxymethylaminomethyl(34) synthesis GTPase MnmE [Peptococcaceae bacterium]|nr:tRNA uridine-5-carboxymethylaminomethyl(34) synthesis GTPase MnmE [Peptococcaceae bacterium]
MDDTIAAISTPLGEGGVGIIRISGKEAFKVARKVFRPARPKDWLKETYRLHYGHVVDGNTGKVIDEVLVSVMKAPRTYTREDVVEINCHGGIVPLRETLKAVLAAGARPADPGEFTKRAFLNGRLDLTQAESVIDIIRSKTGESLKMAVSQLEGRLSRRIREIQDRVLGLLAGLEAAVDFPEDEIEEKEIEQLSETAGEIIRDLDGLIDDAETGRIYREGIRTIIAGRPNVGKSSLLNALLGRERAIVTDIPGTTRDVIEETLNIKGIPLVLMDTAGLRETMDLVERIGVEKARELLAGADLVLFVAEASEGLTREDREILKGMDRAKTILIFNKTDLRRDIRAPEAEGLPSVEISALTGEGLKALENKIEEVVAGGRIKSPESVIVSSARHEDAIRRARKHMEDFMASAAAGIPADLLSIDVRSSWEALGEITGTTLTEDLLERIFNDFCIGK